MWMGTYPTVPSRVLSTGQLLGDYLKDNPQLVGERVLKKYGAEIPFLPKVFIDDNNSQAPGTIANRT
jgi:mannose-6-phosphate isomerase